MTAEAVLAERSARTSAAKLKLYVAWAERLAELLRNPGSHYDDIKTVRSELTRWAPWAIKMPIWDTLHGDLDPKKRADALQQLTNARDALEATLRGDNVPLPTDVFGNDIIQDAKSVRVRK